MITINITLINFVVVSNTFFLYILVKEDSFVKLFIYCSVCHSFTLASQTTFISINNNIMILNDSLNASHHPNHEYEMHEKWVWGLLSASTMSATRPPCLLALR